MFQIDDVRVLTPFAEISTHINNALNTLVQNNDPSPLHVSQILQLLETIATSRGLVGVSVHNMVDRAVCDEDSQIQWGIYAQDGDLEVNAKFDPPIQEFLKPYNTHSSMMVVFRSRLRHADRVRYAWLSLLPSTSELFSMPWVNSQVINPHHELNSSIIDVMSCLSNGLVPRTPLHNRTNETSRDDTSEWLRAYGKYSEDSTSETHVNDERLRSVVRASQLIAHAHVAMLRTLPIMRATMPPTLAKDGGVPFLLAVCVHIALNPVRFGLDASTTSQSSHVHHFILGDLRAVVRDCVPSVTDFGETAIDAVATAIIRAGAVCEKSSHEEHFGTWRRPLRHIPVALCDIKLSTKTKKNLKQCADIGLHIISIFHMTNHRIKTAEPRARWEACKHWNLGPDTSNPFTPEVWENMQKVQEKYNFSELPRAAWPLSLIPVRLHQRALINDVILSGNDVAVGLLNTPFDSWFAQVPGAVMLDIVTRRGWHTLHLDDVEELLVSNRAYAQCAHCNNAISSFRFVIPQTPCCVYRMCDECVDKKDGQ